MPGTDGTYTKPGFQFIGNTKDGSWGMYVERQSNTEESNARRQELEQIARARKDTERKQFPRLLSTSERDGAINQILSQLNLFSNHREDLLSRGLTEEQINQGMFKSVVQWQKLDWAVNYKLAGVSINGDSLITQAGYLCPVWAPNGEIITWQLHSDDVESGKYKWASSQTKNRPNGPTSHLTNGELPLTCCRPIGGTTSKRVRLNEGILKPWITAQKRGEIILGTAGGNFAGSPQTLESYLDQLAIELGGIEEIILEVDAGAVANRQVMRQYRRTYQLLKKLGYELKVGWWGQYTKGTPDPDEYDGAISIITWSQFEAIHRSTQNYIEDIKHELSKLGKHLSKQFKGFGEAPATKPIKPVCVHIYQLGNLPTPEEYVDLGLPKIQYTNEQRLSIWLEAVEKGWHDILDLSAPGLGKSYSAGLTVAEDFNIENLYYLATDHRNPTTETVEQNYVDLVIRHNGLEIDETRKTACGEPFLVHPRKKSNVKLTPGNCHRHHLFNELKAKNIPHIESGDSPICMGCSLFKACQTSSGYGYGFRNQRCHVLAAPQIRAHPDSLPFAEEYKYSECGLFWDEASTLIKTHTSISVTLADFNQTIGQLTLDNPEVIEQLRPVLTVIKSLLSQEVKPTSRYGFDNSAVWELLPYCPTNLNELIEELEEDLAPNLDFLRESADKVSTEGLEGGAKKAAKFANRMFRQENNQLTKSALQEVTLNWLAPLLQVWSKEKVGAFRCEYGVLSIYMPNLRHRAVASNAAFNIYLDATMRAEDLALKLGVKNDTILLLEQVKPTYENLKIIQVVGMGKVGKDRSETMDARLSALKKELIIKHPNLQFLEWKKHASNYDGYHFRDGRGINRFKDADSLCSVGVPYPNLGQLAIEYHLLTGVEVSLDTNDADAEFQNFVEAKVRAEILQEAGRLRSHLRPNEELYYYFIGDHDLSFLINELTSVRFEQVEAVNITPLSGTVGQQTKWLLASAYKQLVESGKKVTQTSLAQIVGITQERVSQIASELGGWKALKELLVLLLTANNQENYSFEPSDEDLVWATKEYLPLLVSNPDDLPASQVVAQVLELPGAYGWEYFTQMVVSQVPQIKASLLAYLIEVLPSEIRAVFVQKATNIVKVT
ncbi:hypothetical protein [Dulcicalothrix desertica]|uniref:hypothetical protein n=2 Tax=Dulcicalothrix desertica TaxID=32056 RepID=UPI00119A2B93|nr:hypothetical protein [Dulcicalothrix desertica]TWH62699.1 hypothetical protein CAL7102_00212 [Dulcicalothrix desertica PCC 7102]